MVDAIVFFDHVHHISQDPQAAASWYVDKLGGKITSSGQAFGSVQIRVDFFTNATVIVRGARPGEQLGRKQGMHWGVDHFGLRIQGDFEGLCNELKTKGVVFTDEPKDINPTTRVAFIKGPDDVSIELLLRRK
jgi:lactoylglutathione lyase